MMDINLYNVAQIETDCKNSKGIVAEKRKDWDVDTRKRDRLQEFR